MHIVLFIAGLAGGFTARATPPPSCAQQVVQALERAPRPSRHTSVLEPVSNDRSTWAEPGCEVARIPSGGWNVVEVKPIAVAATSELEPASGRYAATLAIDGDPRTAWVEGAEGAGLGQALVFVFESPVTIDMVQIIPGYAKSETLFAANHRVQRAEVSFIDDEDLDTCTPSWSERFFDGVVVTGEPTTMAPQTWNVAGHWCHHMRSGHHRAVVVRLADVVKGTQHDDTAISEVRFFTLEPVLGDKGWVSP